MVLGPAPRDEDEARACERRHHRPPHPATSGEPRRLLQVEQVEADDEHRKDRHPAVREQEIGRGELAAMQDLHEEEWRDTGGDRQPGGERQPVHEDGLPPADGAAPRPHQSPERQVRRAGQHVVHEHGMHDERHGKQRQVECRGSRESSRKIAFMAGRPAAPRDPAGRPVGARRASPRDSRDRCPPHPSAGGSRPAHGRRGTGPSSWAAPPRSSR